VTFAVLLVAIATQLSIKAARGSHPGSPSHAHP
jgi:hypothetical protein